MNWLHSIVFLCFLAHIKTFDIIDKGKDIIDKIDDIIPEKGKDLIPKVEDIIPDPDDIFDIIPSPDKLFSMSKELLFAMPEKAVLQGMNYFCSSLRTGGIPPLFTPSMKTMSLRLHSGCNETSFPLDKADDILDSPDFDVNKPTVIFVTGWISSSEQDYVFDMANAYRCRGGYNFLGFNTAHTLHTLYTWSAFNTQEVGKRLANALVKLSKKVRVRKIHLIGHSLGAHVVGYAGRYFRNSTGLTIPHITGLDPAFPCFSNSIQLYGLQRGDAEYVDVLHTNPGVFGQADPMGDSDFYAQGLETNKPGCVLLGCSHFRAFKLYTESVYPGNENNFMGISCTSLNDIDSGFCNGPSFPMGYNVPIGLSGNYFFRINGKAPFGKNNGGRPAIPRKCIQKC